MRFVLSLVLLFSVSTQAAVTVVVNGSNHTIPQTNEKGWGTNVTAWIQAISQYTLQNSGGTFTLTAETYTGPTYGFKVPYIKTATSTPSTAGVLRLAASDSIGWRNNANGANLLLAIDGSDNLTFNGLAVNTPATATVQDSTFRIYDDGDNTKKIAFEASGVATATTRTITMPDAAVDLGVLTASTALNTVSTIVKRDGSGNFAAGTITANLTGAVTGNASTATALAADPADCSANNYATAINASGTLTCGLVNAAAGLTGAAPIANGGTNNGSLGVTAGGVYYADGSKLMLLAPGSSGNVLTSGGTGAPTWTAVLVNPMTTGGDIIYGGASGVPTRLANGTSGQVLMSAGGTSPESWATVPGNSTVVKATTTQKFLSTGTTTGWLFTISTSSTVAINDTYTNNGNTYTILNVLTAQSGQVLFTSGASAPLASGTLTKGISASGPATITFTAATALATYTLPSGPAPLYIRVRIVGAGGSGAGGGSATGTAPGNSSSSFFGPNFIIAGAGSPGGYNVAGGAGGTATLGTGPVGIPIGGSGGGASNTTSSVSVGAAGAVGGTSALGGAGAGGDPNAGAGGAAATNSGSGGGGGGSGGGTASKSGSGGGSGGYVDAIITSPASTYVYAIGTAGAVGGLGTSGAAGGLGAAGILFVEEHYQ